MRPHATLANHGEAIEMASESSRARASSVNISIGKEVISAIKGVNDADSLEDQNRDLVSTRSTAADAAGMRRMGKEQQLVRYFQQLSIASFTALSTAAWEMGLFVISPSLYNGGRSGLIYSSIWCFVGYIPVYLSMAEMASMCPIAGAQYHWVSEFAPDSCQRILSYITGWTSTIAWQAGNAMGIFLVGSLVQTIILINNENYAFPNWHGTLLAIGACLLAYFCTVYGSKQLPYWQNAVFAVHVLAYVAWFIPVWVSAPRASHSQVWSEFSNTGGFNTLPLALLVGQLSAISNGLGVDTAAHMAEETKNAAIAVPRAILAIFFANVAVIFPGVVTICYHMPDLEEALGNLTTYPFIYVLRQSMSQVWVTVILAVTCLILAACNIVYLAAVSRDLFAFARDRGFPFSEWLSAVHPIRRIPVNASILTTILSSCLALIYIGSPLAFYAITSLYSVALLQCYCLSIGCCLWRRIARPETMPPAQWSLGKWGVPVNAMAVAFSLWAFFWAFWPQEYPITAAGFNWASPIFGLTLIVAMIFFVFKGRHRYFGPVTEVEGRKIHSR